MPGSGQGQAESGSLAHPRPQKSYQPESACFLVWNSYLSMYFNQLDNSTSLLSEGDQIWLLRLQRKDKPMWSQLLVGLLTCHNPGFTLYRTSNPCIIFKPLQILLRNFKISEILMFILHSSPTFKCQTHVLQTVECHIMFIFHAHPYLCSILQTRFLVFFPNQEFSCFSLNYVQSPPYNSLTFFSQNFVLLFTLTLSIFQCLFFGSITSHFPHWIYVTHCDAEW